MRRSILSGLLGCAAVVVCVAALLGACSSSDATGDGSAGDVGGGDAAKGDVGGGDLDASGCASDAACKEDCLDAKATKAPIFAWAATWGNSSNASLMTQLTTEARRCQWKSLNDRCTMYDCLASEWTGAAATMKGTSAGKVTIGNGSGTDEVFVSDAHGVYDVKFWSAPRWKEGDKITFTGAGAAIPAFTLTIDFPKPVVASDPLARDAGTKSEIDRSAPLTYTWTPTDEKVLVAFGQLPTSTSPVWDRRELWCIFDGAAGTGTVPADVLQHLKVGMGQAGHGIGHYNRRCYNIGGFHVQATATSGTWWDATVK